MSNYSADDLVLISDALYEISLNLNSAYTMCCLYCERDAWMNDAAKQNPVMDDSFILVILNQLCEAKRKVDLFVDPKSDLIKHYLDAADEIRVFLSEQAS